MSDPATDPAGDGTGPSDAPVPSRSGQRSTLLIWRHGQTAWNAEDRIQGQTDVDLDDTGRAQAVVAAARLAEFHPAAIVASDMTRVTSTAAALVALTGLEVRLDPRLRERHFGRWEGMTGAEVAARFPDEYARWRTGQPIAGCDVEEADELGKRVTAALRDAAELVADGTVVVVCHGGSGKYGLGALLGWPPSMLATVGPLRNCHWIELRSNPVRGWRLWSYNNY